MKSKKELFMQLFFYIITILFYNDLSELLHGQNVCKVVQVVVYLVFYL